MGPLLWSPPEPLTLELSGLGKLTFLESGGDLLLTFSREIPPWDRTTVLKALELASPVSLEGFGLGAGYQGGRVCFMARLPQKDQTGERLLALMELLTRSMEKLAKA